MPNSFDGLQELMSELEGYMKAVEKPQDILVEGAKAFKKDLLKLPKPKSQFKRVKDPHLVDSFAYKRSNKNNEVEIGWGIEYGRFVEYGTNKMAPRSHLRPTWDRNRNKYYKIMLKKAGLN